MYNIGICDDGENICTSIENMLLQCAKERNIQIETNVWYTGGVEGLFGGRQPMDFLVKPITMQQIEDSLKLAVKLIEKNTERFEFQNGRDHYYIPYGEIIYSGC